LCGELRRPQHAVQLSSGRFVVTQHDAVQCVCIVDSDGRICARYQGPRGFGACRERRPAGLAVSRRGRCAAWAIRRSVDDSVSDLEMTPEGHFNYVNTTASSSAFLPPSTSLAFFSCYHIPCHSFPILPIPSGAFRSRILGRLDR